MPTTQSRPTSSDMIASPAAALSLGLLLCTSCSTVEQHAWQTNGDDRRVELDTSNWELVPQRLYVAVPEDQVSLAADLLETEEVVLLDEDQERVFGAFLPPPQGEGLRPYLIRGVTMGRPTFSLVRRNPATNEVVIFRAIWNGEMKWPFASASFGVWPVVIYLKEPPFRVYATALHAGDTIMYGRDPAELDRRIGLRRSHPRPGDRPDRAAFGR